MTNDSRVEVLAERWAAALADWAIPEEILQRAPEPPWGFPVKPFTGNALASIGESQEETPSRRRAREALAGGGTVLDVGAGAGAGSLPLAPPATHVEAVDESAEMLDSFSGLASDRGVRHRTTQGRWPDIADGVEPADVVVCHHVAYNVADIVPFVRALDSHARTRVVVELTASHPLSDLNEAWRVLHGVVRPDHPTAEDLRELVAGMGMAVQMERFSRGSGRERGDVAARVALARRRLCVGPERDEEIAALLPWGERRLVTLWWDAGQR